MRARKSADNADSDRLDALFADHSGIVWSYVRRRCSSDANADDVSAEAWVVACRRSADIPEKHADAKLWLLGVARLVVKNHQRSARRPTRLKSKAAAQPGRGVQADTSADCELWECFAALSDDDREILILRGWDELQMKEIAVLLDCSPNAAQLRLAKAKRRLAEKMYERQRVSSGDGHEESRTQVINVKKSGRYGK